MRTLEEPAGTSPSEEGACVAAVESVVGEAAGVVRVEIDTGQGRLALDYDARRLSPGAAEALAQRVAAAVRRPLSACTLYLEPPCGRSCESCAYRVERTLSALPGVQRARVSFHSGILRVAYDDRLLSADHVARAVRTLGLKTRDAPTPAAALADVQVPSAVRALHHRVRAWLAPERREVVFVALTFVGLVGGFVAGRAGAAVEADYGLYGLAYVFGGWYGLKAGLAALRQWTVDIDLLMILAALGALVVGAPFEGAMLLFLFSLSNVLQQYAMDRSRKAIRALMQFRPETAQVRREGTLVTLPVDEVAVGDVFVVRPGDRLPLDGVVVGGASAVDQASLTGESIPVDREEGDEVFGGTINGQGSLEVRVTRLARDAAIARMIRMVEEAQSEKAATQRLIDRFEQPYALAVIGLTALAIVVPVVFLGQAFAHAFYRAMTLMVAASPCALVISTPASVLSAIANAARHGVLFKGGAYVEAAASVRAVAFDKTGTLTAGKTRLTDVVVMPEAARPDDAALTEDELLALAAAVQARSEHHLGRAVVEAAEARGLEIPAAEAFQATLGKGVRACVGGRVVHIGNPRYFASDRFAEAELEGLETAEVRLRRLQDEGRTSVFVARASADGRRLDVVGLLAFADTLRPQAPEVVRALKALGVEYVALLTGDHRTVADHIGREAGVDAVYAELMPEQKVELVERLKARYGSVAMVGDGVNDAPALATASLGIAMGAAGTDVALETADVVLMADDLDKLAYTIAISRKTRRILAANLSFALAMIVVMVGFILTVGLPLPLAVVGHEGSTVLVSLNGLRLLAFRMR